MLDYLYAIRLTTTRMCYRKTNKRRDKKDPVCGRKKPVFLRTRLLTFASFRAPLSYCITTAYISYERTTYDRARLPPRETDYVWPKVREFSMVRHAQNYARGDRISREKGSTYDTIQTTWKRLVVEQKTSLLKSTGTVIAIVGTAFHWGLNGHDLFPRGFVTTKGGGATGQSQIYLWRKKVGELDVAPKPDKSK